MIIGKPITTLSETSGMKPQIIVNAPTGSTITCDGISIPEGTILNPEWRNLPSEYTQLEYLKSTGTQHIDTGLAITAKNWVDINLSFDTYYNNYTFMIGKWSNLSIGTTGYNLVFGSGASESNPDQHTITLGTKYNYKFGQRHSMQDGIELWSDTSYDNTPSSDTIYLFSNNYQWVSSVYSNGKIYSCKIYDGTFNDTSSSTLVGDYVPCKSSEDIYGMYDLVSNTFLTNIGTGVFTAGEVIPQYLNTGTWTINTTLGTHTIIATNSSATKTKTETVVVDKIALYNIYIAYGLYIDFNSASDLDYFTLNIPSGASITVNTDESYCRLATTVTDHTPSMSLVNTDNYHTLEVRYRLNGSTNFMTPSISFAGYAWYYYLYSSSSWKSYLPEQESDVAKLFTNGSSVYRTSMQSLYDWHTYKVEILSDSTKFYIDDTLCYTASSATTPSDVYLGILDSWWQTQWTADLDYVYLY